MKALTLHQPWATLIAVGAKTIETRSWPAPRTLIGERFAIHAAKRHPDWGLNLGRAWQIRPRRWESDYDGTPVLDNNDTGARHPLPLGAVVATARLVDCVPMVRCWDHLGAEDLPGSMWLEGNQSHTIGLVYQDRWMAETDMSDELPFGDFAPGRWAWLLDYIEPLDEPVAARGRQGLWNWEAP